MGTRHLTCVFENGEYKIAQYGQWDGYPSSAGQTILKALHRAKDNDFESLRKNIARCKLISSENVQELWEKTNDSDVFDEKYPTLVRDMGYKILDHLIEADVQEILIKHSLDFAADSLFCEWAYVIDLDTRAFEVYKGFNKTPLAPTERFAFTSSIDPEEGTNQLGDRYYPVKLAYAWPLDILPNQEEFESIWKDAAVEVIGNTLFS